jgi:polysaccharide export outer membrane protein
MGIRIIARAMSWGMVAVLSGCAWAPGMKFDPQGAAGATEPAVSITEITRDLVSGMAGPSALPAAQLPHDRHDQREPHEPHEPHDPLAALIGSAHPYRIGPADVLSVIVWDHPELVLPNLTYEIGATGGAQPASVGLASQTVPGFAVGPDGTIQFPYARKLQVAGLTEAEAQARLAKRLKPTIQDPQISLRVVGFRSQKVYVNGEVHTPGVKPITDVPMTLANALHVADGALSSGDLSRVELVRGGHRYLIDVPHLADRDLDATRILLADGDTVRVPPATDYSVFMMGEVQKPGPLPFHSDGRLTLAQALGQAAANPGTSNPAQIFLVRAAQHDTPVRVFHLDAQSPLALAVAQQFPLEPDDIVYVDAAGVTRWNRVISQLTGGVSGAASAARVMTGY